ncbi:MAG: hypothetical protein ABFD04_05335 [Syntrophomonas sp.]
MKKPLKITLLLLIVILLVGALFWQSIQIRRLYKGMGKPGVESRELGNIHLHNWMTAEEVAQKYGIPVSQVFTVLNIEPQPGDEKLPLQQLKEKYHKSREDMRRGLMELHSPGEQPRPGP